MTEAEWLEKADPNPMLTFAGRFASERKMRLVAVACCRRITHLLSDPASLAAVEAAERFADGTVPRSELYDKLLAADGAWHWAAYCCPNDEYDPAQNHAAAAAMSCADQVDAAAGAAKMTADAAAGAMGCFNSERAEVKAQLALIRDIFGNPFRSVEFSPSWRTEASVALARQMYESRDFSAMPNLADALQDAGCENEEVLNHCRDANATHVRGCWVVDLLLGKE